MNIRHVIGVIALTASVGLIPISADSEPGNGNGQGSVTRNLMLEATESALRDDAWALLRILQTPNDRDAEIVIFETNFSRLTCRAPTFSILERDTIPFEVYVLRINGEPIVTFNTRCTYGSGGIGGEFSTGVVIQGNDSFLGWLENPATDPIHAEVYLESPMSDPPTSTLVLEGLLVD